MLVWSTIYRRWVRLAVVMNDGSGEVVECHHRSTDRDGDVLAC